MQTRIYKIPFYVVKRYSLEYYSREYEGIVLIKKSIIGNHKEIMTGFNHFCNNQDLEYVGSCNYSLNNILIEYIVKEKGFALTLDKCELDRDKNLATFSDIEKYEQNFDNSSFYNYYKRLHIFDKNEKRKIKEKVKKIEGSRRIL